MQVYLVGGAVRDKLLGIEPHEHDWVVVGATPEQLEEQGYQQVGKDFPVFLHPETREEYALARTERKSGKGYTGFEVSYSTDVTLEQDLLRRDLTINAIAEDADGNLIDPFNGQQDIEQRLLRHVSDAFTEDPLRVLRVARFLARFAHLGFKIAPETKQLLQSMVAEQELSHLTPERVWKEWEKALTSQSPWLFLTTLKELGALNQVLPNLPIEPTHIEQQRQVAQQVTDTEARFAALFVDMPETLDIREFCQQLAIPNRYRDAAQMARSQTALLTKQPDLSAQQWFDGLTAIDFWRRPERLSMLLALREALTPEFSHQQSVTLFNAAEQARQIDAKQLLEAGYQGREIGDALNRRRLQVIKSQLEG